MTTMDVSQVIERRFLDLLDQVSRDAPPGRWKGLRPGSEERLRPAAGVLLRLEKLGDRAAMIARLGELEAIVQERRGDRGGGDELLWRRLRGLIAGLESGAEDETADLWDLRLWQTETTKEPLQTPAVEEILRDLRLVLPQELPVREEFLAEAARILLRGRAAEWRDKARRLEGPGTDVVAGGDTSS